MNGEKQKVVALIRVSTKEQAQDDRAGIARQREVINKTISIRDLDCLRIYEVNDVSGTNVRNCPEIQEILRLVETGAVSGVVVADLDRLLRPDNFSDFALLQVFQDSGASLYCGDTDIRLASKDGFLLGGIRASIAGFELRLIKERMQGAKEAMRRAGKCASAAHTLPLGVTYDRQKQQWAYTLEVNAVKEAFRLVDEDCIKNYVEISRRTGIKANTLKGLLRNPIYIGWRVYDKKRVKAKGSSPDGRQKQGKKVPRLPHEIIKVQIIKEPAVPEDRFHRVQMILNETNRRWLEIRSHKTGVIHLAGSIGTCGYCGSPLYGTVHKKKSNLVLSYYRCRSNMTRHRSKSGGCQFKHIRRADLDETLLRFTANKLTNRETIHAIIEQAINCHQPETNVPSRTDDIKTELQTLVRRKQRLLDAYEDGSLSREELADRLNSLQSSKVALQSRQNQSQKPLTLDIPKLAAAIARGAMGFTNVSDPATRKKMMDQLYSRVVFKEDRLVEFRLRPQALRHLEANGAEGGDTAGRLKKAASPSRALSAQ